MIQGDLHLAGCVFGDCGADRDVLATTCGVDIGKKGLNLFEFAEAIDLGTVRPAAIQILGGTWFAVGVGLPV
jgi:hypothetical protein